jgi:hypothetical protein
MSVIAWLQQLTLLPCVSYKTGRPEIGRPLVFAIHSVAYILIGEAVSRDALPLLVRHLHPRTRLTYAKLAAGLNYLLPLRPKA